MSATVNPELVGDNQRPNIARAGLQLPAVKD